VRNQVAQRLHKFLTLKLADQVLLLRLWLLLIFVAFLIRLLGFRRTDHYLERLSPAVRVQDKIPEEAVSYALKLGQLARISGRYVPVNGSCLRQSLLVWWLLRRKRLPAVLRIGISKDAGFAAHAWVELGDRPINDSPDVRERFIAFERVR
jgi:hypothetical protein